LPDPHLPHFSQQPVQSHFSHLHGQLSAVHCAFAQSEHTFPFAAFGELLPVIAKARLAPPVTIAAKPAKKFLRVNMMILQKLQLGKKT
jgi:hypothetical protein